MSIMLLLKNLIYDTMCLVIKMKTKKRIIIFICAVIAIMLMIYIVTAINIYNYGKIDNKQKADVAIVLGAAATDDEVSPVYQERINHAIWLYENDYVDYIITTGGVTEGNIKSEAEIAKGYIVKSGISENNIFAENKSTITEENLKYAKEIMRKENFNSCIIVSDPLHMKRSMLMAKDFRLEAFSSPTPTTRYKSIKTKIPFLIREDFLYLGYWLLRPFR